MAPLFRRTLLTFLLLVLTSCGGGETDSASGLGSGALRWGNFPIDVKADSFLLADPEAALDLRDAMDFWENKAGRHLFTLGGGWDNATPPFTGDPGNPEHLLDNVIFVQGPWPFDTRIAGKTIVHSNQNAITHAVVLINSDTPMCTGDCANPGESVKVSRRKLFAHELGHFLGFAHSGDTGDIMYPEILPGGSLADVHVNETLLRSLTN